MPGDALEKKTRCGIPTCQPQSEGRDGSCSLHPAIVPSTVSVYVACEAHEAASVPELPVALAAGGAKARALRLCVVVLECCFLPVRERKASTSRIYDVVGALCSDMNIQQDKVDLHHAFRECLDGSLDDIADIVK